ncbi:RING finger protein-like protein [Massariosphaeria phaeospora]|uniref:RBR-type E3 ubiquitin transferase n=1 Tax=Massariosphaeria phaeospora TaxID=100035 RepID=A0A7C8IRY3_9PLEO|nr:RING finger protein-like protein [Massariosphaeria phaeospora]
MADIAPDDERIEELNTLQAIYPEFTFEISNPLTAHIELLVAPVKPLPVTFEPEQQVERLPYLPPLHLDITLPPDYPANAPPSVKLTTTPSWLPEHVLDRLVEEVRAKWKEYGGMAVLFNYIDYLQEAAAMAFGLTEVSLPTSEKSDLLEYSSRMKREIFDKESFDCGICLEPKKGSACYRLERCSHVFCRACLQDFYNNCIREGDVDNVKCLAPGCGKTGNPAVDRRKKDRLLSPKELLQIPLSLDTVRRFANIKRKKKIEADSSIAFCPRSWCQGAMRTQKYPKITDVSQMDESDCEDDEPAELPVSTPAPEGPERRPAGVNGMDRLAVCEDCNLAFCRVCLASWHGDFVRCEPRNESQLTEEDQASLNFISKNTSPCPDCAVPCQKSFGCNHMICFQCKTHFCYLCAAWLNPDHPYQHFNDPKIKACFQRLFEMVEGDQPEGRFGGRRGAELEADFWEQEALRIQMEEEPEDAH